MKKNFTILLFAFLFSSAFGQTVEVPQDYTSIQEAIQASGDGDTILVAPGIYPENLSFEGKNIVLASWYIHSEDTTHINQTVIDGQHQDAVVKFEQEEGQEAVLMGFTIANGSDDGGASGNGSFAEFGGALLCMGSSPTICHNRIINTVNQSFGNLEFAAVYCKNSNAVIEYNRIENTNGFFVSRYGGILGIQSNLNISYNEIDSVSGGYISGPAGGMVLDSSEAVIDHNLVIKSSADGYTAGGIVMRGSSADITNNTIVKNQNGLVLDGNCEANLTNVIIYHSQTWWTPEGQSILMNGENNDLTVTYSNIENGADGEGNIAEDPGFVDFEGDDFHLSTYSPCINSGDPAFPNDPDNTRIEMGAFPYGLFTEAEEVRENQRWRIYPNPSSGTFYLSLPDEQAVDVHIFTPTGQLIKTIRGQAPSTRISTEHISPGTYLVLLARNGVVFGQQKLIIID